MKPCTQTSGARNSSPMYKDSQKLRIHKPNEEHYAPSQISGNYHFHKTRRYHFHNWRQNVVNNKNSLYCTQFKITILSTKRHFTLILLIKCDSPKQNENCHISLFHYRSVEIASLVHFADMLILICLTHLIFCFLFRNNKFTASNNHLFSYKKII